MLKLFGLLKEASKLKKLIKNKETGPVSLDGFDRVVDKFGDLNKDGVVDEKDFGIIVNKLNNLQWSTVFKLLVLFVGVGGTLLFAAIKFGLI